MTGRSVVPWRMVAVGHASPMGSMGLVRCNAWHGLFLPTRGQVQPDDVAHLRDEVRGVGTFEVIAAMRLHTKEVEVARPGSWRFHWPGPLYARANAWLGRVER
ncbi:hypothetical protein GCM10017624_35010 [Azotobacter vinelandii]|nr:hypothetical protein GCM10017624_35010 [Azotobacter vinelandii]